MAVIKIVVNVLAVILKDVVVDYAVVRIVLAVIQIGVVVDYVLNVAVFAFVRMVAVAFQLAVIVVNYALVANAILIVQKFFIQIKC